MQYNLYVLLGSDLMKVHMHIICMSYAHML